MSAWRMATADVMNTAPTTFDLSSCREFLLTQWHWYLSRPPQPIDPVEERRIGQAAQTVISQPASFIPGAHVLLPSVPLSEMAFRGMPSSCPARRAGSPLSPGSHLQ